MAKKKSTGIALVDDRPSYLAEQNSERGQENVTIDDLTIPRLDVIQALSPQRKKTDPAYIEGAEEGMLFNSVTGQLYGTEVQFIPVYFRKEYVVWKDRKAGGGFFGSFPSMAEAELEAENLGKEYAAQDVAQHFGMVIDGDNLEEIVCSMSRSKMKASRQLNTLVKMGGGDRFSRAYLIKAFSDTNRNNEDFYNISIEQLGFVPEEAYRKAETMYESVASGQKNVVRDEAKPAENVESDDF